MVATLAFAQDSTSRRGPVVVELFTSEGCSSCPPADRLLARLQKQRSLGGTELILLGEHVDYWNDLGWKDRFSQHSFTERQQQYASALPAQVYTPQMVVNGHIDVAGNDEAAVERAIASEGKNDKPIQVSAEWIASDQLNVRVQGAATGADVLLFVTEDDLSTEVRSGENGGVTLHHAAVVRDERLLGQIRNGMFQQSVTVKWNPEWQRKSLRTIVLVQQRAGGKILGAAALGAEK
jgi:hypothetical protein